MAGSEPGANPYPGPRPFETGETLYGREREIRELYYLLSAERVVVLHSPSGAGKSSLVMAGLIPRLRQRFDVWRPTRVNQEPAVDGVNRYVLSALQGFEEGIPESLRRPPAELAAQTLAGYVGARPRRQSAPESVMLVFDQFEEVLTVEPLAVEAKRELFAQLGELLHHPRVWALFALREDYLAPLDPYARQVPTHLKNRFRIDLLDLAGAREAIVEPARDGGRDFPAADVLVRDLATVKVQQADGSFADEAGRHVEPMQLQVVCRRLWDAMPADDLSIDAEDLESFGNVTEALAAYYADKVRDVAGGEPARERAVREWFGRELIAAGVRAQVLRGVEASAGLANELIAHLLDTHLIRAEKRAGGTWYELAHDRLIEPVASDNARWLEANLSEVQRRAALWDSQHEPAGLLLADDDLAAAERWAEELDAELTEVERRFLEACRKARAIAERERRQARRIRRLAIGASITSVVALAALAIAVWSYLGVRREARRALSRQLAAQSGQLLDAHLDRALLLAIEAGDVAPTLEARQSLLSAVQHNPRLWRFLHGRQGAVRSVALSPDGRTVAAASDGSLVLWNVEDGRLLHRLELPDTFDPVAAFSPDGRWLAVGGVGGRNQGRLLMWDRTSDPPAAVSAPDPGGRVNDLAFCGEGPSTVLAWVTKSDLVVWRPAGGSEPGTLRSGVDVRRLAIRPGCGCLAVARDRSGGVDFFKLEDDLSAPGCPRWPTLQGPEGAVKGLAFGTAPAVFGFTEHGLVPAEDHGGVLAVARGESIELWDLAAESPRSPKIPPSGHRGVIGSVDFLPSGVLASAGDDGTIVLSYLFWSQPTSDILSGHDGWVLGLALSADGTIMASGGEDGRALLWRLDARQRIGRVLKGHSDEVWAVAFGPEGRRLASTGKDTTVRLWDLDTGEATVLPGNTGETPALAFSADGTQVASGSRDGTLHLWRLDDESEARHWRTPTRRPVRSVAFSPDGGTLAAAVDAEILLWDLAADPSVSRTLEHAGDVWGLLYRDGGATLAASDARGQIVLWRVATGDELDRLSPFDEPKEHVLSALAQNPGGTLLAAASRDIQDRCVYLWEMPAGDFVGCLRGHEREVLSVAFDRDGETLFSSDQGGGLIVWDVPSRREIGRLRDGHEVGKPINSLAMSPNGHVLASAADDHMIVLWDLDWRAMARDVAGRDLDEDERRDYGLGPRPKDEENLK